jgi:hypothetical protein
VVLFAGPLDPPAGPITPTYKTLTEVEPRIAINATNTPGDADSLFKITQPGSYYLTGNITGVVGKHGIEIAASGVTLDLMGFDMVGVPGMGFFSGVTVSGSGLTNIAVKNGSVRNWEGEAGVDMTGVFINSNCRVEGVLASGNTGIGIRTGGGGTVTGCSAFGNGGVGINVLNGEVTHCTAFNNTASGISVGTGGLVADCVARLNSVDGIRCANECMIRGNTCSGNGNAAGNGAGIHATGTDNRIEGNNCTTADRGIDIDAAGNFITRNICSGNTTNWDVVAGNIILVVQAVPAGAVSGNAGGAAPGSTDPNANFSY